MYEFRTETIMSTVDAKQRCMVLKITTVFRITSPETENPGGRGENFPLSGEYGYFLELHNAEIVY